MDIMLSINRKDDFAAIARYEKGTLTQNIRSH